MDQIIVCVDDTADALQQLIPMNNGGGAESQNNLVKTCHPSRPASPPPVKVAGQCRGPSLAWVQCWFWPPSKAGGQIWPILPECYAVAP